MILHEQIAELYAKFGHPGLTNFNPLNLTDAEQLGIGVFVLALQDDATVLIKRKPIDAHPGIENYWWLPGGAHEDGERLEQTALREVREETGLEVEIDNLLLSYRNDEYPWLCFFLQAHVIAGTLSVETDPDNTTAEVHAFRPWELTLDSIWMDTDRIILAQAGFIDAPVDALLEKYCFRK